MKKHFIVCACVAFASVAMGQTNTGSKWSLQQCIETGINNSLDVQQSGLQVEASRIDWNQAKLNRLPDLNGSASSGMNMGRSIDPTSNTYSNEQINFSSYGLNSGVILFNGLSMHNAAKQRGLAHEAAKMDWQQAKDNLTINIILAYLAVLSNEDLLSQSNSQAALSQKQVERLELLNREGAIMPSLYYDLKGQFSNDQLAIINAQNAVEIAKLALTRLMNVPYDKNMQLERLDAEAFASTYTQTASEVYQQALSGFSLVQAVDLRRESAERGLRAAKGLLYPTLSFNASTSTNYSSNFLDQVYVNTTEVASQDYVMVNGGQSPVIRKVDHFNYPKIPYGRQLNNNRYTSLSLNLRIPLFNALQARNNVKQARLTLKNNELVANTTRTQLQQSVEQAYVNMLSAADRHKTLIEQVNAYAESFRAAEIRFNSGVGTSIDYLTAKNNLDRANISLINARYDYVLRTRVLDYYQGKQLW